MGEHKGHITITPAMQSMSPGKNNAYEKEISYDICGYMKTQTKTIFSANKRDQF